MDLDNVLLQSNLEKFDLKHKIICQKFDGKSILYEAEYFDFIIISCVLNHVDELNLVLAELERVLKKNGKIMIYLLCDPGIVYRVIRHFMSHMKQARVMNKPISFVKYIWSLEHKNHFPGILFNILWVYRSHEIKRHRFPFSFAGWNTNLFEIVEIVKT